MNLNTSVSVSAIMDKQRVIFPVVALILAFLLGNSMYKTQKAKVEMVKQEIEKENKINALIKEVKVKGQNFSEFKDKVGKKDSISVMQKISAYAAKAKIKLPTLSPLMSKSEDFLTSLPFSMRAEGSYHAIADFVSMLESSKDNLRITHFLLSKSPKDNDKGENLSADITVCAVFIAE